MIGLTIRRNPDDDKLPHKTLKETWGFLQKLQSDPESVVDKVRPVQNAADSRARVAIVDEKQRYGAIFFELKDGSDRHFVYAGTYGNPEAYDRAGNLSFAVNPTNGVVSLIDLSERPEKPARPAEPASPMRPGGAATEPSAAPPQSPTPGAALTSSRESAAAPDAAKGAKDAPRRDAAASTSTGSSAGLLAGHTADELEMMLGIDRAAFHAVNALTSEDGLDDALTFSPGWERDALLGLVAGLSIEEVLAELSFGSQPTDAGTVDTGAKIGDVGAAEAAEVEEAAEFQAVGVEETVEAAPAEVLAEPVAEHAPEPAAEPRHAAPATEAPARRAAAPATDVEVMEGMKHPAALAEFTYVGKDANALRHVIEGGNFNAWRVFLHPSQRDITDKHYNGAARVTGGAGTGKTVVVIHRAHTLATRPSIMPRVFLTTFTRGLADSLKSQMNVLDANYPEAGTPGEQGIWISGIDAFAFHVLSNATKDERAAAIEAVTGQETTAAEVPDRLSALMGRDEESLWGTALQLVDNAPTGDAGTVEFLMREYEGIVLAQGITSLAKYRKAPRPGRGVSLGRADRTKVWNVIDRFHRQCRIKGQFSYPAQAAMAAEVLEARAAAGEDRLFDHVLVDEAQDFHAGHWRVLRAAVAEGPNDIFLAEDSHQRIYGQRLTLSRFGIKTRGRSRRLTVNYRTTRENLGYAAAMLEGVEWVDSEGLADELTGYRSMRSGPKPTVKSCTTEAEEQDAIAESIKEWLDGGEGVNVGVLARTNAHVRRLKSALSEAGIEAVETRNATRAAAARVSVMTMHGAKGLEFTHVVLAGVDADSMPAQYRLAKLSDADREDELQQERALLYVAASRARDQLMVTYTGDKSEFLPEQDPA